MDVKPTRFLARANLPGAANAVLALDAKAISDHAQMYNAAGDASVYGELYSHWMTVSLQMPMNGKTVADTFVLGYNGKDKPPTLRVRGGWVSAT
jgi:hypothetical protein